MNDHFVALALQVLVPRRLVLEDFLLNNIGFYDVNVMHCAFLLYYRLSASSWLYLTIVFIKN